MLATTQRGRAANKGGPSEAEATTLRELAKLAMMRAGRPAGADPRTVAAGLRFRAVPCAEEDAALLVGADADGFRWAWSDDEAERRRRVWEGIASTLLCRVRMAPTVERVSLLVRAMSGA